jgi:hypothetical protein
VYLCQVVVESVNWNRYARGHEAGHPLHKHRRADPSMCVWYK